VGQKERLRRQRTRCLGPYFRAVCDAAASLQTQRRSRRAVSVRTGPPACVGQNAADTERKNTGRTISYGRAAFVIAAQQRLIRRAVSSNNTRSWYLTLLYIVCATVER
jgi:hypothetical protein